MRTSTWLLTGLFVFSATGLAQSATSTKDKSAGTESCADYLKKKQRKGARTIARPDCDEYPELPADLSSGQNAENAGITRNHDPKSEWFPDWTAADFGWYAHPVAGFKYHDGEQTSSTTGEKFRTRTGQSEIGIGAGLDGIPVLPVNPGFTLGVGGQYAVGGEEAVSDSRGSNYDDARSHYDRYYVEASIQAYFGWYRNTLTIGQGQKNVTQDKPKIEDNVTRLANFHIQDDNGVLIRSNFSGHVTYTYDRAFLTKWGRTLFSQNDVWLHAAWSPLGRVLSTDLGPGTTWVKEYSIDLEKNSVEHGTGNQQYFRWIVSSHPFWKLLGHIDWRYILDSSNNQVGDYGTLLLPDQDLYAIPRTFLPKDSYTFSALVGIERLFFGLGVGYQYNLVSIAKSKKDGLDGQKNADSGFTIFYQTAL